MGTTSPDRIVEKRESKEAALGRMFYERGEGFPKYLWANLSVQTTDVMKLRICLAERKGEVGLATISSS